MIVEYAQLMSTCHRVVDGYESVRISPAGRKMKHWAHEDEHLDETLYLPTHVNHPSNKWIRESASNYEWLYKCFVALCGEFDSRYMKPHATHVKLAEVLKSTPIKIPDVGPTPVRRAINEVAQYHCDVEDDVLAYRRFYVTKRRRFEMKWNKSYKLKPHWYNELCLQVPAL